VDLASAERWQGKGAKHFSQRPNRDTGGNCRNFIKIERLGLGPVGWVCRTDRFRPRDAVNGMWIALLATAMLRITVIKSSDGDAVLRVEGRIAGSHVAELRKACDAHTCLDQFQLSLELADVSFADPAGIELLKDLSRRGVGLVQTTPFLTEQLKNGASSDAT
jgi:anti-anti-sigma regulatory factor